MIDSSPFAKARPSSCESCRVVEGGKRKRKGGEGREGGRRPCAVPLSVFLKERCPPCYPYLPPSGRTGGKTRKKGGGGRAGRSDSSSSCLIEGSSCVIIDDFCRVAPERKKEEEGGKEGKKKKKGHN